MHRIPPVTHTPIPAPLQQQPIQGQPTAAATPNMAGRELGPAGRGQQAPRAPRAMRTAAHRRLLRELEHAAAKDKLAEMRDLCAAQERQIEGLATEILGLQEKTSMLERELESGLQRELEGDDGARLRKLIGELHLEGPGTRISHHPLSPSSAQNNLVEVQERNLRLVRQSEELTSRKEELTAQLNDAHGRLNELGARKDSLEKQLRKSQVELDAARVKLDSHSQAESELAGLQRRNNELEERNKMLTAQGEELTTALTQAGGKLETVKAELKAAEGSLLSTEKLADVAMEANKKLAARHDEDQETIKQLSETAKKVSERLGKTTEELEAKNHQHEVLRALYLDLLKRGGAGRGRRAPRA